MVVGDAIAAVIVVVDLVNMLTNTSCTMLAVTVPNIVQLVLVNVNIISNRNGVNVSKLMQLVASHLPQI